MTRYLITPTLLNSFGFYRSYKGEDEDGSRQDFLRTLSRERFEPNESMLKGIKFENDIHDYCNGNYNFQGVRNEFNSDAANNKIIAYDNCVEEIGGICLNGLWQESVKKEINTSGFNFLLYGRTDVIKEDSIYDIKRTAKYDLGKYQGSAQHRIYLYCSGLPKFSYLISNGKDCWSEDYTNHDMIETEICVMIYEFVRYLDNNKEAGQMYFDKWISR